MKRSLMVKNTNVSPSRDDIQMINDFENEMECTYKGETYSVRDNGAIMRHAPIGSKPRPTDNIWTFGKYDAKTGYAKIAGEVVHRIVATAFHGPAPSPQYVVDHIDTNRRNNRPENLRWVTKLENILLNPITAKKIILLCGSIEEFLKDPSILKQNEIDRNFAWMRAVSKEEAAISLERMLSWAKSDKTSSGGTLGTWIFERGASTSSEGSSNAMALLDEVENFALGEKATQKPIPISKSNPFNFSRAEGSDSANEVKLYKTRSELLELIKTQFESVKKIKLPNITLPTAGRGIVIRKSWTEEFQKCEYCREGKSRIPKSIILHCNDGNCIALLVRIKSSPDKEESNKLKKEGYNIAEIDLSWAKDGVTESEMEYILQKDCTKKRWIYHNQISKAKETLLKVCEPIDTSGQGVLHSYFACPLYSDNIEDIECWYCDYRIDNETDIDGELHRRASCFGKSRIQTYEDLLSVINVEKEDEIIVGITYNKNGKMETIKFNKEVQLPGKTIFQLWNERTSNSIVVHNIYSGWYVLIEEDPQVSFDRTGGVYGKLGGNLEGLKNCLTRSIFSFDSCCWEIIK